VNARPHARHSIWQDWVVELRSNTAELRSGFGLRDYFDQGHRPIVAKFAFIRSLHEGEESNDLRSGDRRLAGLEKLHDFHHQRRVSIEGTDRRFTFFTTRQAVVGVALAEGAGVL
jgi:hypothetical protein